LHLALWLVRTVSPDLAALTAKYLIVDSRLSQSAYALSDNLVHTGPIVRRFERWARAHVGERFSLDVAAAAVGTSKRTLASRMQTIVGRSPLRYLQGLRFERALHLLSTASASMDDVAERVGYGDGGHAPDAAAPPVAARHPR